ncbi:MAG TPA: hypothetical protein VF160_08915 [Candidatus Dormibacteraeota bacterium]
MDALQRARDLYERGEIHDALERAQSACEYAPRDAEAWWLLARVSRHAGLPQASDQAFRRASELSKRKPLPARVTAAEFSKLVERARASLSPDARRRLARTRIQLSALPEEAEIRAGVKPDALSHRARQPADVLTLYQVNLENRSANAAALQAAVVKALSKA